jgi:ribosomal RNA-processing protein 8
VADIAKLPVSNRSVDICVFCLSLMGTNYINFLQEARRVLKSNGELLIAEVESRCK